MGLLVTSSFAAAQDAPATTSGGQVTIGALGAPNVASSKFQEYRDVPKGVSIPYLKLFSSSKTFDFNLEAKNVRQADQRYTGWANLNGIGVSFDYNQIPHNMGNNGRTFLAETSRGVWSMSPTLRQTLGDTVDAVASTARTYTFYAPLLAPTLAAATSVDLRALRQRGEVELDLSEKLPFDLTFSYMRELKSGSRGESGGTLYGVVQAIVDVPEPLNEITQDFGARVAYNFKSGNVHASLNRNIYNDRVDSLVIDNPFRATDLRYSSANVPGGPAQGRYSTLPDNEATRGAAGFLLKFAHQTRIGGDFAFSRWTQNAQFLPFTINSTVLTGAGAQANVTSSLPQQSLDGKINTTTVNMTFSSRPVKGLGVRAHYRLYDLTNKTTPILWAGTVGSGDVERNWTASTVTADTPYGFDTANPYNNKTSRFDAQVSYDIRDLTLEGAVHAAKLDRTHREASSGNDNGFAVAAVYHSNEWLNVRGFYDQAKRTAKGWDPATSVGLQADEAERKTSRTGVDIELTPLSTFGMTFAYARRNVDYPNRPNRAAGVPDTSIGLLNAKFDTFTVEAEFTPSERAELNAYYTYDKNASTNRTVTLTSGAVNNNIRFLARDRGDTFGANAVIHVVPEKWTFTGRLNHQKMDGILDVNANTTGAFYLARVTLNPPGPQNITDYDDTQLTTAVLDLAYTVSKSWTFSVGYAYEKYKMADAFSDGTTLFPLAVQSFLKANDGGYKANIAYAKLNYRF